MSPEKLMTTDEVADLIGVKPSTIRKWRSEQRIPFVKLNGAVRFKPRDIQEWIDDNTKVCS